MFRLPCFLPISSVLRSLFSGMPRFVPICSDFFRLVRRRTLPSSHSPSLKPPCPYLRPRPLALFAPGKGSESAGGGEGGPSKLHLGPDPHLVALKMMSENFRESQFGPLNKQFLGPVRPKLETELKTRSWGLRPQAQRRKGQS